MAFLKWKKQKSYFFFLFGESFLILATSVIFSTSYRSYKLYQRFKHIVQFEVYHTASAFYFPASSLEGDWGNYSAFVTHNFLKIDFSNIKEFLVEPSRGIKRVSPTYYKILINNCDIPVYIRRAEFYGKEKDFLDQVSKNLKVAIIFNDKLR